MTKNTLLNFTAFLIILMFFVWSFSYFQGINEEEEAKKILDAKLELLSAKVAITQKNEDKKFASRHESSSEYRGVENLPQEETERAQVIPTEYDNEVVFRSQSPFGTWGEIFGETCEEASTLIAVSHFRSIPLSLTEFRDELLRIVDWENTNIGKFEHTNVEETANILRDYYGYNNYVVIDNPSIETMKEVLAEGKLILAPFYGVGMNPYYSLGGPEYHFLVIKGYTREEFITHDVGTKRGENYKYEFHTLMERLHDYHPDGVIYGAKKIIVVGPS